MPEDLLFRHQDTQKSHDLLSGRGERERDCGVRGHDSPSSRSPLLIVLSELETKQCVNMAPKKPAATAEVALVPLKNCLVNLPPSLVSLLVNANTVSKLSVMGQYVFYQLICVRVSACSKCDHRIAIQVGHNKAQWSSPATIMFPRLDGHAEQAQTCAGHWKGRLERWGFQRAGNIYC